MLKKDSNIFEKINKYLTKKGHEMCLSIYLKDYNSNNIYIRFDYVSKLSVYKIVWVDLNFLDEKHLEDYISMQMVTKFLSLKIVEKMTEKEYENSYSYNDEIIGDRVEILSYFQNIHEYIFDRFLPLELDFLIDPLAMIFSYLPRSMEVFLNEIFAKFDHQEDKYNYLKPIKFDLFKDDLNKLFDYNLRQAGEKDFQNDKVSFLEKIDNRYVAIVDGKTVSLVIIELIDDEHILMWCNCKCDTYCKHICSVIKAIRNKKFNNFYKVSYTGQEKSLLDKVTVGNFYLCFGVDGDKILLITSQGTIFPAHIMHKNKCVFEVIEDDDDCSLSKYLKELSE